MDTVRKSNAGQGFGVAGFVIGLIALIVSFIPCLGMYALLPGIIALVFSIIAISQASVANAPKGLIISALIISILGTSIASWQFLTLRRAAKKVEMFGPGFEIDFGDEFGNEIRENIRRAVEGLDDYDTNLYDTMFYDREEMIEELERLEGEIPDEEKNNN